MVYDFPSNTLDNLQETVDDTVEFLTEKENLFDVIVVRGVSGLVVGAPVALALGTDLAISRKEPSHMGSMMVNEQTLMGGYRKWIFLDDFISSGMTLEAVKDEVRRVNPQAQLVGTYLYHYKEWRE